MHSYISMTYRFLHCVNGYITNTNSTQTILRISFLILYFSLGNRVYYESELDSVTTHIV